MERGVLLVRDDVGQMVFNWNVSLRIMLIRSCS